MLIRFIRTAVVPVWFLAFGFLALLWSPLTVGYGMLLLVAGVVGPASVLILIILLWEKQPVPADALVRAATVVPRLEN
jgi:hypothetical protein